MTDDERREVARRLREIRPCKSGHIKWWEIARALGLKQPAGWFGWEKFEPDSANRLADLIEPPYPDATASYKGWRAEVFDPDGVLASPSNVAADLVRAHADGKAPSDPKVRCVAEVKIDGEQLEKLVHDAAVKLTGIDRDALLALADEMEDSDVTYCVSTQYVLDSYARRIREALGVTDG